MIQFIRTLPFATLGFKVGVPGMTIQDISVRDANLETDFARSGCIFDVLYLAAALGCVLTLCVLFGIVRLRKSRCIEKGAGWKFPPP